MNFMDLAKARFSTRKFTTQPVEDEKLAQILEAGKLAPTAPRISSRRRSMSSAVGKSWIV